MGAEAWHRESFLGLLSPQDRLRLTGLGIPKEFAPGDVVLREGAASRGAYVILSGAAKVTAYVGDGRSVLIDVLSEGDLAGEFAVIDGGRRSATVTAGVPITARAVTAPEFVRFLDGSPAASRELTRALATKARRATRHQLTLNVGSPVQRLARVLIDLAERCSTPCSEGVRIGVPLSQAEIADYAGMSPPHLQRAFAALRHEDVVVTRYRSQVITDCGRLREIGDASALRATPDEDEKGSG
jgi:CRP/FNR family cyclic AMP-dependent transcriptional regulator